MDPITDSKQARRKYLREYMKARRAVKSTRAVTVELTPDEYELIQACIAKQKGPVAGALKRFLLIGAKFSANSGTARGKKVKAAETLLP